MPRTRPARKEAHLRLTCWGARRALQSLPGYLQCRFATSCCPLFCFGNCRHCNQCFLWHCGKGIRLGASATQGYRCAGIWLGLASGCEQECLIPPIIDWTFLFTFSLLHTFQSCSRFFRHSPSAGSVAAPYVYFTPPPRARALGQPFGQRGRPGRHSSATFGQSAYSPSPHLTELTLSL